MSSGYQQIIMNKQSSDVTSKFCIPSFIFFIKTVLIIPILLSTLNANSQSDLSFNGYIKGLGMYYKPLAPIEVSTTKSLDYLFLNQLHNRLNFKWYASNALTIAVESRNQIFFGQMIKEYPAYKDIIDVDQGYFDLGTVAISADSWFLHTMLDRAWVDYTTGKWQIRLGRQRVNWGTNLVWNPNDVFNTFSYFDFDYEERPGTDGVRIQYYTSVTSSAELVYKIGNSNDESALAGMYRFSKFNYDIQFLGGSVGKDYVLGAGWSGDIKGGGFRGEATWFRPRNLNDQTNFESLVASISGDYTFKNSLYLHVGALFNSHGTTANAGGRSFFAPHISAKMLSFGKYNLFAQSSFPFSPLISGTISAMLNPSDGSSYLGPALSCSLADNWEIMINGQLFFGHEGSEYGDYGKIMNGRIKWSF